MGGFVRKAVRGLLAVSCVALAVLAPVDANWETGEIEVAEAACQGPDCMPITGWVCQGREGKCNLMYDKCRNSEPETPGEEEGESGGPN